MTGRAQSNFAARGRAQARAGAGAGAGNGADQFNGTNRFATRGRIDTEVRGKRLITAQIVVTAYYEPIRAAFAIGLS